MADSHHTLTCPACHEAMQKVLISSVGVNIDICTHGCGGIFFDNREFKLFDNPDSDISEIILATDSNEFKPVDESLERICPACGAKMVKNFANRQKDVQIDECYTCGGKFLDHGEFTKLRG